MGKKGAQHHIRHKSSIMSYLHCLCRQGTYEDIICHACSLVCDGRCWGVCKDIISCQGTCEKAAEFICHNLACDAFIRGTI